MRAFRVAIAVAAGAAALLGAGPATADDASYLAALDAHGLYRSGPPNARLSAGHRFCADLRAGANPEDLAARYQALPHFGAPSMIDDLRGSLRPVIDVAQHELCPETLR